MELCVLVNVCHNCQMMQQIAHDSLKNKNVEHNNLKINAFSDTFCSHLYLKFFLESSYRT